MWLGQSMYVGGVEVHLACQRCSHLGRAMDIGGHHMYNLAGVYCGSGMLGLWADY
jgi:hypothetical protein